jgi:hypothetical protein
MSVSPGFTAEEIREFVYEYHRQRHGTKFAWLRERGFSEDQIRRWRKAVFDGDIDRALIPREGSPMTVPPGKRSAFERSIAAERDAHAAQIAKLQARNLELEGVNAALGKAIGLLHQLNAQEPDAAPTTTATTNDPSGSSPPKPPSSPS